MPAKPQPKNTDPAASTETPAATPAEASAETSGDEEQPIPMNRAERRARGKGGAQPSPHGVGKVAGGKGPAGGHRLWANRRGGG